MLDEKRCLKDDEFLSGMKNLKEVGFLINDSCSKNLIYAIACLAENDSIGRLVFDTQSKHGFAEYDCGDEIKICLKRFTKLKTIRLHTDYYNVDPKSCDRIQLLIGYSEEILSNVETIEIISMESELNVWEFLKFVPKLRELYIISSELFKIDDPKRIKNILEKAAAIITILKNILKERKSNESCDEFIELKVNEFFFGMFRKIYDIGDSIKLILIPKHSIVQTMGTHYSIHILHEACRLKWNNNKESYLLG